MVAIVCRECYTYREGMAMKIIYKQSKDSTGSLHRFGVSDCYFKEIALSSDQATVIQKQHQHTGFELHMVKNGCQTYIVDKKEYRVEAGHFLLIAPKVMHQALDAADNTHKYAITFHLPADGSFDFLFGELTPRVRGCIETICGEADLRKAISATLIENAILEILVWVLRLVGMKERQSTYHPEEKAELTLAKQYIDDNIVRDPSVSDVAAYCHISNKQLTRIFQKAEGMCPGEYIIRQRVKQIECLLAEGRLSIRQISENLHFSSEHYLNAFFKKYAGMTPGAYRKMQGK